MKGKVWAVVIMSSAVCGAALGDPYGVYSNIRTYATGGAGNPDTHEYLGYSAVPFLAGHSEASFSEGGKQASAVGNTFVTYGSLHVDQVATSSGAATVGTVTHDGNPSAAYFDRLFLNGSNVGASVTVHVHGWLSDVVRASGNHWDAWNVPQGLDGGIQVTGYNVVPVQDFNISQASFVTGPQYFDVVGTVGSFLDISSYLLADSDTIDTFISSTPTAFAQASGTLHSTFTSADPNVTITSASGHDYTEPVPEPATFLAVGVGIAGVLRRRKRN